MVALAAVTAAACAVAAIMTFRGTGDADGRAPLLYMKDRELHFVSLAKLAPQQVTSGLFDKLEKREAEYLTYSLGIEGSEHHSFEWQRPTYSQDHRYLFYPDEFVKASYVHLQTAQPVYSSTLKRMDMTKKSSGAETALVLDSDVHAHAIDAAGSRALYTKGRNWDLYVHNMRGAEKLDSQVYRFFTDASGSAVVYIKHDGSLYFRSLDNPAKEKIDTDATLVHVSADLGGIYYLKEDVLILKAFNEEKKIIDSGVDRIVKVYDDGTLYYVKSEQSTQSLIGYVQDDLASGDAPLSEPDIEDYTQSEWKTDWWGFSYESETVDYDAYDEALAVYGEKLQRDELRTALAQQTITLANDTLIHYDGHDAAAISDRMANSSEVPSASPAVAEASAVIIYMKFVPGELPELKLSELASAGEVESAVEQSLKQKVERYVAIGRNNTKLDQDNAGQFGVAPSGDSICYIDYSAKAHYALMQAGIVDGNLGTAAAIDNGVAAYYFDGSQGSLHYFKFGGTGNELGELYRNRKLIDIDVLPMRTSSFENSDALLYRTGVNGGKRVEALKIFNGMESVVLAEEVREISALAPDTVVFMADYNERTETGTVYWYDGTSVHRIDTDVFHIL